MNSSDSNRLKIFSLTKQQPPQLNLNQALTDLQSHFTGFFHQHLSVLQRRAKNALDAGFSSLGSGHQVWARISGRVGSQLELARGGGGGALSSEAIEERLGGIPVYALSNDKDEFVLVSGVSTGKSLGLLCFKEEDAAALLEQMRTMNPMMRQEGSRVVTVALKKVVQLKVNGVAFRFIPDATQVKNALQEREKAGFRDEGFFGVPVFQSRSLVLQSQNRRYRPVFFRKEDLEKSLARASRQQNKLNPLFKQGDIQVAVFEDIIKGMKEGTSTWNDVVFVPPGFDVSTAPPQ